MTTDSRTHTFFLWLPLGPRKGKGLPGASGWGAVHGGKLRGGEGHTYVIALLGLRLCHSSQPTHQVFTPPFLLTVGGLIQWALPSHIYLRRHQHNTQTRVMPGMAHAS